VKIRARAIEHAALPIFFEGDLDAMSAQMLERGRVLVVPDGEGMMHTAMVVGHRIDRRVTLDQDDAGASRIEERHPSVRRGEQMPAADDLGIKPSAVRDIAHRDTEMGNAPDRNHPLSLRHSYQWPVIVKSPQLL